MSPLGIVDARDADLAHRRFRLAAAAGSWLVTMPPSRPRALPTRLHAGRTLVELDTLLAFGIVPVSVGSDGGGRPRPWRSTAGEACVDVIDAGAPDTAARLRDRGVDLAVVSSTLARVAPREVHVLAGMEIPVVRIPDADVPGQLYAVGAALGMADRADTLAAQVRSSLRRFRPGRRPASVVAFTADESASVQLFTRASPLAELLERAGLPELTGPSAGGDHTVAVTVEELADLDAETILGLETVTGVLAGIEADPSFARSCAVRGGGYRRLDPVASYAVAVPSVLTVPAALDALRQALSG